MVHVDAIGRRFGTRVLFEGLSWTIPKGVRLGFVGPNGAGKTTLLRILAGQETPDSGEVRRPATLRVGYLPQEVESLAAGSVLAAVIDGLEEIRRLGQEVDSLESRLATLRAGDAQLETTSGAYGVARARFEALGGDQIETRARVILGGLGVPESSFAEPLERLSGGWRMRVVLARLLLGSPDLLLLDEPTNHLDLRAIGWLEAFLDSFAGAFVVVSHDRYFLNRMVRGIVELERGKLTTYPGAYDAYLAGKEERRELLEKAARHQAAEIARTERFIERFRFKATKARQVQSRIRALEKIDRIETDAAQKRIHFGFPPAPRSGDVVVRAEGVIKVFGDNAVYSGADFLLRRGDRVALVGPNGAGKSTLLKMLDGRVQPDAGRLEIGHNVVIQYYAQHHLDALDPAATVLEEIESAADASFRPRLRTLLGRFLFSGEDAGKAVGVLSGGEKARLALAKLLLRPANLLLLDEPTNHLDLKSREVLEEALNEYEGTLVFVSHDRYFINRVATSIGEVGGGRVEIRAGDFDSYLERLRSEDAPSPVEGSPASSRGRESRRVEAEERNRRYRARRAVAARLAPLEAEVANLEGRIKEIAELALAPAVYRDRERAKSLARERADSESRLAALYRQWEEIAVDLDGPE